MLYTPIKTQDFLPEENFDMLYSQVIAKLNDCKESGKMPSFDNLNIYYEYFLCENAKENIVIVHGLSEFTKKFYEVIYFFLNNHYNVFIFDLRGHGYSDREDNAGNNLHVKNFFSYVKDLDLFIKNIVKKVSSLKINFFSQSMGGAIVGLYLQQTDEEINKAIFSAPMISPNLKGLPRFIVKMVAKRRIKKFGGTGVFLQSKPFTPNVNFENSSDASFARFSFNLSMRVNDINYQTSPLTNCWMEQATRVKGLLLRKKECKKINAKCLILSAELDKVVLEKPQRKFAKLIKDCKFVSIANAKHNIFCCGEEVLAELFGNIKDFLNG